MAGKFKDGEKFRDVVRINIITHDDNQFDEIISFYEDIITNSLIQLELDPDRVAWVKAGLFWDLVMRIGEEDTFSEEYRFSLSESIKDWAKERGNAAVWSLDEAEGRFFEDSVIMINDVLHNSDRIYVSGSGAASWGPALQQIMKVTTGVLNDAVTASAIDRTLAEVKQKELSSLLRFFLQEYLQNEIERRSVALLTREAFPFLSEGLPPKLRLEGAPERIDHVFNELKEVIGGILVVEDLESLGAFFGRAFEAAILDDSDLFRAVIDHYEQKRRDLKESPSGFWSI